VLLSPLARQNEVDRRGLREGCGPIREDRRSTTSTLTLLRGLRYVRHVSERDDARRPARALERVIDEIARAHDEREVGASLASLTYRLEGDVAVVSREAGSALADAERCCRAVRVERSVYVTTPTTRARVRLLELAAILGPRIEVHVPIVTEGTHRGRLAIDLPRRVLAVLGRSTAEPGDRFSDGFRHAYFDDELLLDEARQARLSFLGRRRGWVELARDAVEPPRPAPPAWTGELLRALRLAPAAERSRKGSPPELAVRAMRQRGQAIEARGPVSRARLRRAIGWVDAAFPGGPNCFRRTLLELGLDGGAASETIVFGLDVGRTGHVAFKDAEERDFDVAFAFGPDENPTGSTAPQGR
jgi:hypothetical protein